MSVENAVKDAIEPIINQAGLFLEALQIATAGKHRTIRVLIDGEKSLSLDEVTAITKPISERLDALDVLGERAFTLEVSSPGIDFPLTLPRHWRKNQKRLVQVVLTSGESFTGRIINSDESSVEFELPKVPVQILRFDEIKSAHIEIEFK